MCFGYPDLEHYRYRNEELEEEITAKATINELLEDEHTTDIEQLLQWAAEMDEHEEDLMTLLKYQAYFLHIFFSQTHVAQLHSADMIRMPLISRVVQNVF